jgi:hypothetical protein
MGGKQIGTSTSVTPLDIEKALSSKQYTVTDED